MHTSLFKDFDLTIVLYFKAQNMLSKNLFIAKILVQIGVAIAVIVNIKGNDDQINTVSRNWHKTQVFIYYDYSRFMEDKLNCLGTVLTRRFILTAASCVFNSDVPLKDAIVYHRHDKKSYGIKKYTVNQNFDKGARFQAFAVLSLRKNIELKNTRIWKWIHFDPQDKPEGMYLNLNVKTVKYVLPSFFLALTLQIGSVTCL